MPGLTEAEQARPDPQVSVASQHWTVTLAAVMRHLLALALFRKLLKNQE